LLIFLFFVFKRKKETLHLKKYIYVIIIYQNR
jgi:hypothetical protein